MKEILNEYVPSLGDQLSEGGDMKYFLTPGSPWGLSSFSNRASWLAVGSTKLGFFRIKEFLTPLYEIFV